LGSNLCFHVRVFFFFFSIKEKKYPLQTQKKEKNELGGYPLVTPVWSKPNSYGLFFALSKKLTAFFYRKKENVITRQSGGLGGSSSQVVLFLFLGYRIFFSFCRKKRKEYPKNIV